MVERNLTLPYDFVCFTDDSKNINPQIHCEPLPELHLHGWWYKLWFLSQQFPLDGNVLFLDLDLIVFESINKLFEYQTNDFCIIRDFNRSVNTNWNRINSSVFRYQSKKYHCVYEQFIQNHQCNTVQYRGDQDYLFAHFKDFCYWPDAWIQSYKWEMRDRRDLIKINGKRNFKHIAQPKIDSQAAIAVFHGEPNPQDCTDPWVVQHWR
jgi:hypothetical protein